VVIMGQRTFTSVPDFAFKDRDILEIHASDRPEEVLARFPSRVVFIGGGPTVTSMIQPQIDYDFYCWKGYNQSRPSLSTPRSPDLMIRPVISVPFLRFIVPIPSWKRLFGAAVVALATLLVTWASGSDSRCTIIAPPAR